MYKLHVVLMVNKCWVSREGQSITTGMKNTIRYMYNNTVVLKHSNSAVIMCTAIFLLYREFLPENCDPYRLRNMMALITFVISKLTMPTCVAQSYLTEYTDKYIPFTHNC